MVTDQGREIGQRAAPDWSDWALFLDIDGTLLDLAPTPEAVTMPPDLLHRLDTLSRHLSGAVALISGRSLAGIDRLFPGGRDAAGLHGAEWRRSGHTNAPASSVPPGLLAALAGQAAALPGVRIEPKPGALALHFSANPAAAPELRQLARAAMAGSPVPLRLIEGKNVVELAPAGIDKGLAIERFLAHPPYQGRIPVFLGDDLTDEDGFRAVNRRGGLSAHVGGRDSAARYRLSSPAEVRRWLDRLATLTGDSR